MRARALSGLWLAGLLVACASQKNHAPIEERGPSVKPPVAAASSAAASAAASAPVQPGVAIPPLEPNKPLPGAENAGKPGYYTVKPGDTIIRIGLESGQNWKDVVKWNNLENPNVIEVGQVLRVVAPNTDATTAAVRPVAPSRVETRTLDAKPGTAASGAAAASAPVVPAAAPTTPPAVPTPPAPSVPATADEDINWAWPSSGPVAGVFDEGKTKGLTITGKTGDPVLAAADGRVVYAGSGLRGYGNLVILKHNATYLTAYAHNQTLLVKEDQAVRRGQKIAEMGSTDADRVQLHFEIRKQGKPVDPTRLLPPR